MELEHHYGPNVHLSSNPFLLSLLARASSPEAGTAEVTRLVRSAYRQLFAEVLGREFPTTKGDVPTRMAQSEPRAVYTGPVLDSKAFGPPRARLWRLGYTATVPSAQARCLHPSEVPEPVSS